MNAMGCASLTVDVLVFFNTKFEKNIFVKNKVKKNKILEKIK